MIVFFCKIYEWKREVLLNNFQLFSESVIFDFHFRLVIQFHIYFHIFDIMMIFCFTFLRSLYNIGLFSIAIIIRTFYCSHTFLRTYFRHSSGRTLTVFHCLFPFLSTLSARFPLLDTEGIRKCT